MKSSRILVFFILLFSVWNVQGQDTISIVRDTINMVVVTGTRTPKLLDDVPVQTRVITGTEIERLDATNIADLLQTELPAIEFSYSMDQQTSLNLQGFGGNSVLFLVDGERLAGETLDNVDYARLAMDNVARIEIVKVAASSLYGSNAVGGVVNIITKQASKPWAVNLNSRYGSHSEWRNGGSVSLTQGRFNSVTDLIQTSRGVAYLGPSIDPVMGGPKENYRFADRTLSAKERLGIKVSDKIRLTARGGYYFRERHSQPTLYDRYRDFSGGVRMNYSIDAWRELEVAYSFDQYDKSDFNTRASTDVRDYSNRQNILRALYNRTFEGGHILTLGGDATSDYLSSYQFAENGHHDMTSADAFAQFDWRVSRAVTILSGARLDYYSLRHETHLSPKLAVMWRPGDFVLRASYGSGFRAPTLKERYMEFDMADIFTIFGNPALRSETSHNFMLSGEYTRRRWSVTVAGYFNSVANRITTVFRAPLEREYVNTDHVNIAGADANFALKLPAGFGARLSYAYTRELLARGERNISAVRPHTAVARFDYGHKWKNWGLDVVLSGRWLSGMSVWEAKNYGISDEYELIGYPSYSIWKLSITGHLGRSITLTLTADNLFNYTTPYFRNNSPSLYGTAFYIGLSMNIEELFR
jgi:outer membrane receptor for ferrienterochelin and colicins